MVGTHKIEHEIYEFEERRQALKVHVHDIEKLPIVKRDYTKLF